jgi:hypothetical protein
MVPIRCQIDKGIRHPQTAFLVAKIGYAIAIAALVESVELIGERDAGCRQ